MSNDEILQKCEERLALSKKREEVFRTSGQEHQVRKEQAWQILANAFRAKLRLEMSMENQQEELN